MGYLHITVASEVTSSTCDNVEGLLSTTEGDIIGDEGHIILGLHAGMAGALEQQTA